MDKLERYINCLNVCDDHIDEAKAVLNRNCDAVEKVVNNAFYDMCEAIAKMADAADIDRTSGHYRFAISCASEIRAIALGLLSDVEFAYAILNRVEVHDDDVR